MDGVEQCLRECVLHLYCVDHEYYIPGNNCSIWQLVQLINVMISEVSPCVL